MQFRSKSRCRGLALIGVAFPLLGASSLNAQQPPLSRVEEMVVTATRFREPQKDLPIGVTVINEQQIRNSTAATVPELLMQFPGVHVRDNSGSPNWQVDLRGFGIFGDQNTLVLLDGQRISENEQTSVNWAAIPLSAIERIEIMRGSGAVLYGGGATGGTINIVTKAPQLNRKRAFAGASYGSYGTGDYRAGLNLAGDKLGLVVNASHLESDGYRDANRLRQQNGQADLRFTGERGTLYAKFGGDDQHLLLPNALTEAQIAVNRRQAAAPFGSFTHTSGGYLNLGGELKLGDAELALNGGFRGRQTNARLFFAVATHVTVKSLTPRLKLPFAWGGMNHTLVAGLDWDDWDYDSIATSVPIRHPLSTQRNVAAYFQDTIALTAATAISAGARVHRTSFSANDIATRTAAARDHELRAFEVAARHRIAEPLTLYAKFGTSFRVPNVNDNYNLFTGAVTLLEPQSSHDREIGVELARGRASYRLALYEMDVNNEIHFNPVTFSNVNLAPTRRNGVEFEGKLRISDALGGFANYTYATAKFREGVFTGNDVPLVPRHRANVGVAWEFMPRTRLNAVASYVGEQAFDGDEANTFGRKMPSYTLVNLQLNREAGGWLLGAGVKNLFNREYFSYGLFTGFPTFIAYPAAGRAVFVSAQFTFR